MEISSIRYLCFWSIINQLCLLIALVVSHDVNLPVPELIRTMFSRDLVEGIATAISFFSSFYVFSMRPMKEPDLTHGDLSVQIAVLIPFLYITIGVFVVCSYDTRPYNTIVGKVSSSFVTLAAFTCSFYVALRNAKNKETIKWLIGKLRDPFLVYPNHSLCLALFTASLFSVLYLGSCQGLCEAKKFFHVAASFYLSIFMTLVPSLMCFTETLSHSRLLEKHKKKVNMIQAALVLLGIGVAQYFLQEKSVSLLVMLFSCTIYWLATCARLQVPTDCGILNFFIGATFDCAISLFGLRGGFTWIVFAACLFLYSLQSNLSCVELRYPRARITGVTCHFWLSPENKAHQALLTSRGGRVAKFTKLLEGETKKDELSTLFIDLYSCAAKLSMEKMTGKQEESKDKLIDKLLNFTLALLKQNEEIVAAAEEEKSRDELIHTLCHLYFRLRSTEEEGKEEDEAARNCQIALCLYQVVCQLQKQEKGDEQEEAKQMRIIRLCRLILAKLCRKNMETKRRTRKNKKVKEEIGFSIPGL